MIYGRSVEDYTKLHFLFSVCSSTLRGPTMIMQSLPVVHVEIGSRGRF